LEEEVKNWLEKLTVKEKIKLLRGNGYWESFAIDRVGLNKFVMSDGPHGLRHQTNDNDNLGLNKSLPSTCFPTASATACSFDPDLIHEMGAAMAQEAIDQNVDVILGPGVSLKRNPLCGRNFEYFSEDPLLAGRMGKAFIEGVQSKGVGTSLKHFACNNQEKNRLIENSIVDERSLHEIYLKSFEKALEANPWTIMSSYNQINGVYSSENPYLLKYYLREHCHFKGLVVSDWGAICNILPSFQNGLNLEMPGLDKRRAKDLYQEYRKKNFTLEELNEAVTPVLELAYKVKTAKKVPGVSYDDNFKLAEKIEEASAVLLKNEESFYPLSKEEDVLFIGEFAKKPRYQGEGSSNINPYKLDNFHDALTKEKANFFYCDGFTTSSEEVNEELEKEALEEAKHHQKIVFLVGLNPSFESEGYDRSNMSIPMNQLDLIKKVLKVNDNCGFVLVGGSPMELPFEPSAKAILLPYLGGCASGSSLFNLLYGVVNPSGHLAETWPISLSDLNMEYPVHSKTVRYEEGEYIGYRYYHSRGIKVKYPFGYGLSYTNFTYDNFSYDSESRKIKGFVSNVGTRSGSAVLQLYLSAKDQEKSFIQLKDFCKVNLDCGEQKQIEFDCPDSFYEMYDETTHSQRRVNGVFNLVVATSVENPVFEVEVTSVGEVDYVLPSLTPLKDVTIREKEVPPFTINSTLDDIKATKRGQKLLKFINKLVVDMEKKNPSMKKTIDTMLYETPFRFMVLATDGKLTYHKIQGIVDYLNGKTIKGIAKLLS
jgi:beta-glucosidase